MRTLPMATTRKFGIVFLIMIGALLTMCTVQKRLVLADPNVAPAIELAKTDGLPVVKALDEYHAAHGYYPRSLGELPLEGGVVQRFNYEVWGLFRVYQSLACAGRAKDFTGFVLTIPDYEKKLDDFLAQCVRGYSAFLLKTRPIQTAWGVNRSVVTYAQFASQNPQWVVDWCSLPQDESNSAQLDCSRSSVNEALPPDGMRRWSHAPLRPPDTGTGTRQ
jgi:hypothetical protein